MYNIQTLNAISDVGLKQFPAGLYQVGSTIMEPDAILVRSASMLEMNIPGTVRVIGRAGVGVNNIPVPYLTERGIPVLNTPGANANAVCELVIAGMLLASRNLYQAVHYVNQLHVAGDALDAVIEEHKKQFAGRELSGKTLGVVGLGSIGVKVANAALNLGMHVIGYDPSITVHRAWQLSANVQQARDLPALLHQADFISLHIPLGSETKHLINQACFNSVKSGSVLLNFAREEIVEQNALIEALHSKKIASYVTDFPLASLRNHPQVIALPHLGASTKEAEENCAVMVVKQVRDFLEQGTLVNAVNFPVVELPPLLTGVRLAIINANIPNMVAQISSNLAKVGINIASLVNNSQGDIAYTVIDIHNDVGAHEVQAISSIAGVKHVRKLLPI